MEKDLTLLIPMYNKAPYIERMVKSLSEQTYLDRTKIIVCDDKSTDNSIEILKHSAEKYNVPMILMMNQENLGLSRTIRRLYRKIETDFWTVLDPDDYYVHSERLSRAVEFLKANPDFAEHVCNCYWQTKDGVGESFTMKKEKVFFEKYSQINVFAQTSSATFRNFWNDEILSYIDKAVGNQRFSFAQEDGFRNFAAVHYGKICFDNFIGSFYTKQETGIWSTISDFEQTLLSIQCSLEQAKMSNEFFHNDDSTMFCLRLSANAYFKAIDTLHDMMNNLTLSDFRTTRYVVGVCRLDGDDINAVFRFLVEKSKALRALDVVRVRKKNIKKDP